MFYVYYRKWSVFMLLENLFAEYLLECQIRKFTPKTIRGYKNCIDLLVRYCKEKHGITDVKDVSHIHIRMFFKELTETNHKESYINTLLKSYRAFFKYAIAEEYIDVLSVFFSPNSLTSGYFSKNHPLIVL